MRLKVLFHDNCFDGAASAALFSRFYREKVDPKALVVYLGVQHKAGDAFPPDAFDGDVNCCVDFRFSRNPHLEWWFDHHVSAFSSPEDRAAFEADTSTHKYYDPDAKSCTKFEAKILRDKYGFDVAPFADLIHWADIIDGAQFPDARTAVELDKPALQLMTWVENNKDKALAIRFIEDLTSRGSLADIAAQAYIQDPLAPLLARHQKNLALIKDRAREIDGVVRFDLTDTDVEAHNKFIAYFLFPRCRYTVGLTKGISRVKISVGSNPWSAVPRTHNIASICERYGGGGHPVVGAISFPPGEIEKARKVAADIAVELSQG
jgi:hypothetical protein